MHIVRQSGPIRPDNPIEIDWPQMLVVLAFAVIVVAVIVIVVSARRKKP